MFITTIFHKRKWEETFLPYPLTLSVLITGTSFSLSKSVKLSKKKKKRVFIDRLEETDLKGRNQ